MAERENRIRDRMLERATGDFKVVHDAAAPIPMLLWCPRCHGQHVDEATTEWDNPPHRSHLCAHCGCIWRPADVPTVGVERIETIGLQDNYAPVKRGVTEERVRGILAEVLGDKWNTDVRCPAPLSASAIREPDYIVYPRAHDRWMIGGTWAHGTGINLRTTDEAEVFALAREFRTFLECCAASVRETMMRSASEQLSLHRTGCMKRLDDRYGCTCHLSAGNVPQAPAG